MILRLAVLPQPRRRLVALAGRGLVGVGGVGLEVGRRGVEEQQIDLEIEQMGDGEEHGLLHRPGDVGLDEQVHRPVGLIVVHLRQPGDDHVFGRPFGRGQLRHRRERPVRDQGEQHPLDRGREPSNRNRLLYRRRDPELAPQPVEQPGPADRPGARDLHRPGAHRLARLPDAGLVAVAEMRPDRRGQTQQPVDVDRLNAAQVHRHLRLRAPSTRWLCASAT